MLESREHRRVLQRYRRTTGAHLEAHREALAEVRRTLRHSRTVRAPRGHREALEEARERMARARCEHKAALEQNRWLLALLERLAPEPGDRP